MKFLIRVAPRPWIPQERRAIMRRAATASPSRVSPAISTEECGPRGTGVVHAIGLLPSSLLQAADLCSVSMLLVLILTFRPFFTN